ncbi:MAG: hypothetical protein BHW12_04780 [Coprobacillus sp. 28_7]|nr:MAG: hypothetical protein BHW12_04780 [Coprobacillus sp. 28_7]
MKTIHMMIGIPGSGKTTFVKKLASEKGYDVVSTDIVRANHPQMDEKDVWPTVYKMIGYILLEKDNCIFDATNTTKKVRDRFKENVNLYIKDYQIYGYYFPTNYKECIKRVEKRNTQKGELYLPVDVIKSYGENIYPPTYEESFTNSFVMTQKPNLLKGLIDDAYQGYGFYFKSENEEVEEYSGFANINTCEAIRENTNFRLASVTKQFIAYAIMTLVEKNKISLEDTLYDFFPNMPEYTKEITIKNLLNHTSGLLDYEDMLSFINMDKLAKEIDKLNSIELDATIFDSYCKESEILKQGFHKAYEKALAKTNRATFQAMEAFVHNLNTMHSRAGAQVPFSSINFGTDTSAEGRMVIENFLLATEEGLGKGETPIFPVSIFKVKEGVNYNPSDKNYDLFKLACRVSAKRLFPNFSFLDAPFNLEYYKEGDYRTEVGYMGCRTRVMADVTDLDNQTTGGRGNLSFTSINLPRIGIKHGICLKEREKADMEGFYQELGEMMDLVKDQLLERFELQCSKHPYNFPFLIEQGLWAGGEKLGPNDRLYILISGLSVTTFSIMSIVVYI